MRARGGAAKPLFARLLTRRPNFEIKLERRAMRERENEIDVICADVRGFLRKTNRRAPKKAVKPTISEIDAVGVNLRREHFPSHGAADAAHLEHVAKICVESEFNRNLGVDLGEIGERNALEHLRIPDQARALDVNDALWHGPPPERRQWTIGKIRDEENVVVADRGAQQGC